VYFKHIVSKQKDKELMVSDAVLEWNSAVILDIRDSLDWKWSVARQASVSELNNRM